MDPGQDFFISYTAVNRSWAEWIAVQLERATYSTVLQSWDFRPGADFLHEMQRVTSTADRTIAVLSPAYFGSEFGEAEWRAAFSKDPTGALGLLVPVRVQPCEPPGLLAGRVFIDLVDEHDEATARRLLLDGVDRDRPRPTTAPFPGANAADDARRTRFPGLGPELSNLHRRNPNFSGRTELLQRLHAELRAGSMAAVLPTAAVHGLGGVGKTQLALEYAHRFGSDYDIAWWIPAEQPSAAIAALAGLASRLGVPEQHDRERMVSGLFDLLRRRGRWLLVYDNAERPDQLTELLPPGGDGHVLVTSRWQAWGNQATPLALPVLSRPESVGFLRRRTGADDEQSLGVLAELLGDLPLALEEAGAYLEETHLGLSRYLELVRDRSRELFASDDPVAGADTTDHHRVATVWSVSLDRVRQAAPTAEALLDLCGFLAPELPRNLPTEQPQVLPAELAAAISDPLAYNRMLAVIGRYSLATVTPTTLGMHRLVQTVVQVRLGRDQERAWAETASTLIRASFPDHGWKLPTWPSCERLLPSLFTVTAHARRLQVAPEQTGWLLNRAAVYLRARGQYLQAKPLAEKALTIAEQVLGPDHPETAQRHDTLGRVMQNLGDLSGARAEHEQALRIGLATLGPDDITVGTSRGNLGRVLGLMDQPHAARAQLEQSVRITEAALGPDHHDVGIRRGNLGIILQHLGDLDRARTELERSIQIIEAALGPDHHDVGIRRGYLGWALQGSGDLDGARTELELAVQITEAALGPDHPTVGNLRGSLALVLEELGDLDGAQVQLDLAFRITHAALGPDHLTVVSIRGDLERLLSNQQPT